MKYILRLAALFSFSFVVSTSIHAQIFNHSRGIFDKKNKKMVQELLDKTTYTFLLGDEQFTTRLKDAFVNYWTVNKYQFIGDKMGVPLNHDFSAVFNPTIITAINGRGNTTTQSYPFLVYGKTDATGMLDMENVITAFPVNLYYEFDVLNDKNMFQRSLLRLPYAVKNLNEMLLHIKSGADDKAYYEMIEKRSSQLANKTLIIPADLVKEWDVNPNLTALMSGFDKGKKPMKKMMYNVLEANDISYKGKYKVMTDEEIIQLEKSGNAGDYCLFLPAIADKKYIMVYDLKTKDLLYYEDIMMSMKIKSKDFEKLNKAAGL